MATKAETFTVLAYIGAGIQKPLSKESAKVYCDLLADLPCEALQAAAQRVLLNHKWSTFPSIAEIREEATKTVRAEVVSMSAGEAWGIAWRIAGDTDPDVEGSFKRVCARVNNGAGAPEIVLEAIRRFGMSSLFEAKRRDEGTYRAQFMRIYEQLAADEKQRGILPPKLATAIESGAASGFAAGSLPAIVSDAAKSIGVDK